MEREYTVYQIVSKQTGMVYIGCTGQKLNERWRQHRNRALREWYRSPFCEAIRKEGANGFIVSVLAKAQDQKGGWELEHTHIASIAAELRYNQSKGGFDDAKAGSIKAWERINETPETRKEYLEKLSVTKKANDHTDYVDLALKNGIWRKNNPREAYKNSRRASRIAAKIKLSKGACVKSLEKPLKERLLLKHKGKNLALSRSIGRVWANRTPEEIATVGRNIAEGQKEYQRTRAILPDFDQTKFPYAKATVLRKIREGMTREEILEHAIKNVKSKSSHWTMTAKRLKDMGVKI